MKCVYCTCDIEKDNKNAFKVPLPAGIAVCGRDCWEALGIRLWRIYHNVPYDADQLNLGIAEHDPYWDVPKKHGGFDVT